MLPYCEKEDIGVIPWSPLARGYLARPHEAFDATTRGETDDYAKQHPYFEGNGQEINERVQELADEKDASMAQIALSWVLHKEWVDAPIVGTTSIEHLEEAVEALEISLSDTLGIEHSIVQAPVGSATTPELAAAVADAGGLGTLAVTWREPAAIREQLAAALSRTDGVVGANLVVDETARNLPLPEQLDACLAAGVDVVSLSFGKADPYVEQVHEAGATVLQTVGSAEAARDAVEAGVDAVVAQGWEAGGHVQSEVATMPLVPRVVDAVPETPVVAAGGIADGRGIAAALALGADGAWLGTRFLATEEANVHEAYRERVTGADETETAFGEVFDEGWPETPHRVLENETVQAYREAGRPEADRPGEGETVAKTPDGAPVSRYEDSLAVPGMAVAPEKLPLYAGQSVGLTGETRPAGKVVETLVAETREAIENTAGLLGDR